MTNSTEEKKPKLKCGLIMPISAIDGCSSEHWEEVRTIIREALKDTEFEVNIVSDSNEIGIIQNRIVNNIYNSDIVICDVSCKNPNVMFELGMRLAFDKPTIIIKDEQTNYTFDTGQIEHIEYPRDLHYPSILEFKAVLKTKVEATYQASLSPEYTTFLKHFGEFKISHIDDKEVSSDEFLLEQIKVLRNKVDLIASNTNRMSTRSLLNTNRGLLDSTANIEKHGIDYTAPSSLIDNEFIEEKIKNFKFLNAYSDEELSENKERLISYLSEQIQKCTSIPSSSADVIARAEILNRITIYV
ncbi:hypothetical protein [Neptuniibacter sp.]|uniref:hypothetical protein n=1 Tax=Neptuniibacter sp. TaxID=1962643 RepID=UPI003B5989BC